MIGSELGGMALVRMFFFYASDQRRRAMSEEFGILSDLMRLKEWTRIVANSEPATSGRCPTMTTVSVSKLKTSLSEYLDLVRGGEEVLITARGKAVARLSKVEDLDALDARIARLARQGLVRPGTGPLGKVKPPPGKGPSGVLAALLEERREGR